jgi:GxxExxY protein
MTEQEINALCDRVRQIAYDVHLYFGYGHLEKVYENALSHRLLKVGINVEPQYPLRVFDVDGTLVGEYFADLLIEDVVIVELKTAKTIAVEHEGQVLAYLKTAKLEHGLLINFGSPKFQIRKFAWSKTTQHK